MEGNDEQVTDSQHVLSRWGPCEEQVRAMVREEVARGREELRQEVRKLRSCYGWDAMLRSFFRWGVAGLVVALFVRAAVRQRP